MLLDPRLLAFVEQDPSILKQFKNYSRSPLEPAAYSGVLAGMNQDQLQASAPGWPVRNWRKLMWNCWSYSKPEPKPLKIAWTASEPQSPHRLSSASP